MRTYNLVNRDSGSRIINIGSSKYPGKFEETLDSYDNLRNDVNDATARFEEKVTTTAANPTYANFFAYSQIYLEKFIKALQTEAGDPAGAELYSLKDTIPEIQNGNLMWGGSGALTDPDTGFALPGFFVPNHVYTDNYANLEDNILYAIDIEGKEPDDVSFYLKYRNDVGEWEWVANAGISAPDADPITSVITTPNAISKWGTEFGDSLLNTGVIITENNEMHGQGVVVEINNTSFTLDESHRGKVIRVTTVGGIDITVPIASVDPDIFTIGFQCTVINSGAGDIAGPVQIKAATGATLEFKATADDPPVMDGQHSAVSIINLGGSNWGVYGDLALAVV